MSDTGALNDRWGRTLISALAAAGVRRVVISPGSRSTPLALPALRHGGLDARVVVDERSAAFFALGLAKAEKMPTALIATSGSAVANWYPAVVEADMARVPLLLISADRPPELQDCGANQTMDQIKLFAGHVRQFHQLPPAEAEAGWLAGLAARAVGETMGPLPGPVHLNVPLREPLVTSQPPLPASLPASAPLHLRATLAPAEDTLACLLGTLVGPRGAIVCGPEDFGNGFADAVVALARRIGVPIFADALSGLRFLGSADRLVLAHPDAVVRSVGDADWILRFGPMPVCRAVADFLGRCRGRPQVVVNPHSRVADPPGLATHLVAADPALLCTALASTFDAGPGWAEEAIESDRRASALADQACAGEQPFEGSVLRALAGALPASTPLFLGNSLAVRAADWFAGRSRHRLPTFGNRGLAGIDGNLSTFFGITAAAGPGVAVVGDITFQHDLGGLCLGRQSPGAIVVLDNGGGGIFDHLAQSALPEFDQGWLTPQCIDMAAAARVFGLEHRRTESTGQTVGAVLAALAEPTATIVQVPIDRGFSLARSRAFFTASK
jgi:2-succinyl-5-enolpyruvyl-6-hydroxy-3-cyclohexene-1-carboxylate synthase